MKKPKLRCPVCGNNGLFATLMAVGNGIWCPRCGQWNKEEEFKK